MKVKIAHQSVNQSTLLTRAHMKKNNKHIEKQTWAKRLQSGAKRPVCGRNVLGRNVQGAKRLVKERNVQGRNVKGSKRPVTVMSYSFHIN